MQFKFDYENRYEPPMLILCNPDFEEIEIISYVMSLNIIPRFNSVSELSFRISSKINDSYDNIIVKNSSYDLIKKNKLIHLGEFGYFIIVQVNEKSDGVSDIKEVIAYSYEYTLNMKTTNLADGTYKFYDELDKTDTLIGKLISVIPSWSIGHVDSELWNKYRTFSDVDKNTLYTFLMTDVEKAYDCIFDFDTINKAINIYDPNNAVKQTDVVLNFNNLIKDITISQDDSSIKTALGVYGGNNFTIRTVNPLGTPIIYNFDYFKNIEWMSPDLISSITNWENKIVDIKDSYAESLARLKDKNASLIILNGELVDLQNELKALEQTRTAQMPNVQSSVSREITQKNIEIKNKKTEITQMENFILQINNELTQINEIVKFENNFTPEQMLLLDNFIDTDTYINDNYELTSLMNSYDAIELAEQLLLSGQKQLKIISQPNCSFDMNTANFMFMKEFESFINEIEMGCLINAEIKDGYWVTPILLEMNLDYDNPNNFSMKFGNRFRMSDEKWTVLELIGEVKGTSSSVKSNSSIWSQPVKSGLVDEVTNYMKDNLDASNQEIINSANQTITIGDYGLRCRELLEDGSYSPQQLWMNKGLICLTDDNWDNTKLAIGNINGVYSVNAEVIAGNLLAGNQLKITSEDSSFTIDSNGTKLVNADITLVSANNRSKMLLSPVNGIKIQTSQNGMSWDDKFYVDPISNTLVFAGNALITSGTIGGWDITTNGIESTTNYIRSNGTGKLGLMTWNTSSATFNGNIYAANLDNGGITTNKIANSAVTPAKLDRLYASEAYVQSLVADKATIGQLNALSANIENLYAKKAEVRTLIVQYLNAADITVNNLTSYNGLSGQYGQFQTLKAAYFEATQYFYVDGERFSPRLITTGSGTQIWVLGRFA